MNDNGLGSIYDITLFCANLQLYSMYILNVSCGYDGSAKAIAAVHCWPGWAGPVVGRALADVDRDAADAAITTATINVV